MPRPVVCIYSSLSFGLWVAIDFDLDLLSVPIPVAVSNLPLSPIIGALASDLCVRTIKKGAMQIADWHLCICWGSLLSHLTMVEEGMGWVTAKPAVPYILCTHTQAKTLY